MSKFNLVIIDTPPRLGLSTINALCASTHLLIPAILDGASVANVGSLIDQLDKWFRKDLNQLVKLCGIVGVMTTTKTGLNSTELDARKDAEEAAQKVWGPRADGFDAILRRKSWPTDAYVLNSSIADTARFHADAGKTIAYIDERASNGTTREMVAAVGVELTNRLNLSK